MWCGIGMPHHIIECLLDKAEDRHFIVARQPCIHILNHQIHFELVLIANLLNIAPQRGDQPQVIKDHGP